MGSRETSNLSNKGSDSLSGFVRHGVFMLGCMSVILSLFYSCVSEQDVMDRLLLEKCGSCHLVPEPKSLTEDIWRTSIFPKMSEYFIWEGSSKFVYANKSFYNKKGSVAMNDSLWVLLQDHFGNNALEEVVIRKNEVLDEQTFFDVARLNNLCDVPSITAMDITNSSSIWFACDSMIASIDRKGKVIRQVPSGSVVSYLKEDDSGDVIILNAGELRPHNMALGSINKLSKDHNTEVVIKDDLFRPVYAIFNNQEITVSEFGHDQGRVTKYLLQGTGDHKIVHKLPGSYKLFEVDIDGDDELEIVVQSSQASEGIYIIEERNGLVKKVISFPPEYGLSDVDTADINNDGHTDLVVALGDNADHSNMLKEFHGIEVYINDGKGRFTSRYKYPMYGATQVQWIDVNHDDYLDLVVAAYFPHEVNDAVRILLNKANVNELAFTPYQLSESMLGRWMTMEKGDVDQDGDEDLILGSYMEGPTQFSKKVMDQWYELSVDALILFNK